MATELKLVVANDNKSSTSYKKECYFTAPLKVGEPRSDNDRLHMILMMASAGILKGDEFIYDITCEKNSKLLITEQSYSKLFDMGKDGSARKRMHVKIEKDASLWYKPCAVMPFKNSCFYSFTDISIQKGGELFWTDIFTAGRVGMGEKFAFRHYESRTRVSYDGHLVWIDGSLLEPDEFDMENLFYYGNYTHQGTCFYCGNEEKEKRLLGMEFDGKEYSNVYVGITQAQKGVCIRVLANQSQDIEDLYNQILDKI